MARQPLTAKSSGLFRTQIDAALDYVEGLIGAIVGVTDGDKGDITVSGSGTVWNIDAGAVGTTEISDGAVTFAKLAGAAVITSSETIAANDNDTSVPTTGAVIDYVTSAVIARSSVVATTSGSTADVTGIPTSAVAIDLHLLDVSLSGTDQLLVQLLDGSGNPITTGYTSTGIVSFSANSVASSSSAAGFIIRSGAAADAATGTMTIRRQPGTQTWVASHTFRAQPTAVFTGGGSIAAGVDVTGVRITRTGTNTFDNGSFFAEWRS